MRICLQICFAAQWPAAKLLPCCTVPCCPGVCCQAVAPLHHALLPSGLLPSCFPAAPCLATQLSAAKLLLHIETFLSNSNKACIQAQALEGLHQA